uniref:Uncharacterized protein n=1 Tax=viral metagenome TaxID=1070528 RepID=A0A6C0LDJ1_9ZZZZ
MDSKSKEEDPAYMQKRVVYQAIEVSLLLVGAFIFYDIINFFRPMLLKLLNNNKYTFHSLRFFLHILFIFTLDLILRSIFAFAFKIPI